jgi:hypothetical protein
MGAHPVTTDASLLDEEVLSIDLSLGRHLDTPGKREKDQERDESIHHVKKLGQ